MTRPTILPRTLGGWWSPNCVPGPRHSGSADFTSMFIARENKMVQPVVLGHGGLDELVGDGVRIG